MEKGNGEIKKCMVFSLILEGSEEGRRRRVERQRFKDEAMSVRVAPGRS